MKRIITAGLGLIFTAAAVSACFAADAGTKATADLKIGYVDIARTFDEYSKTKDSDKILEEKSNKKQAERDKLVSEIKVQKDEMELLSEKAKSQKQAELDDKVKKLQEFDRTTKDDLKRERDLMMRDILKEIDTAIDEYAKANGYDIILNNRVLLYGNENFDVTNKIIQELNNKYKNTKK